ncbi:glycosyltransferase family 4 protein [Candidatus Saccharibacteria bacterium]|nr:glycosyltransferase family 4 protein [Candidatus Saccharibacteria bacterium]
MVYLVCQEWYNTKDNHAGIKHLCNELQRRYPDNYKSIVIPEYDNGKCHNKILKKFWRLNAYIRHRLYIHKIVLAFKKMLKPGDKVLLTEYLWKANTQLPIADAIKRSGMPVKVYAMAHLVPSIYDKKFSDSKLKKWIDAVDGVMTLGHSLSDYLVNRGVEKEKVFTTFHYVDLDYYHVLAPKDDVVTVIAMGNMMRNVTLLQSIVKQNSAVHFIICQGANDLSQFFEGLKNVELLPYISEAELRDYMNKASISLNVMVDTIGSNVIVTSMAMGLAMICSDVGSIRDYCDEKNTVFCDNHDENSWTDAIKTLSGDISRLKDMQKESLLKSRHFSFENFHCKLQQIMN